MAEGMSEGIEGVRKPISTQLGRAVCPQTAAAFGLLIVLGLVVVLDLEAEVQNGSITTTTTRPRTKEIDYEDDDEIEDEAKDDAVRLLGDPCSRRAGMPCQRVWAGSISPFMSNDRSPREAPLSMRVS